MACGCGQGNILQRTLFYPVTELDKFEHELVSKNQYHLEIVPDWQSYSFLASYSTFDGPSQTVLAALAIRQRNQASKAESLSFLAGLRYPLLITTMAELEIDLDTCQRAVANLLTEEELIAFLRENL